MNRKKTLSLLSLCLAALLLLALAGCHAKEPGQTAKPAKPAEGAAITAEDLPENTGATETLEYVYRRVEAFLPEDADDTDDDEDIPDEAEDLVDNEDTDEAEEEKDAEA